MTSPADKPRRVRLGSWPEWGKDPGIIQSRGCEFCFQAKGISDYKILSKSLRLILFKFNSTATMVLSNDSHASTRALHADDHLNLVADVAPPIHLSTTFRFPNKPEELIPSQDPVVCLLVHSSCVPYHGLIHLLRQSLTGRTSYTPGNLHPMRHALKLSYHLCSTVMQ